MACHIIILYPVVNNYTFSVARYVESRASFWRNHVIAYLLHSSVTGGDLPCDDCALVSTLMGAVCPTECTQVPISHPWRSTQQLGRCISQLRKRRNTISCTETKSTSWRKQGWLLEISFVFAYISSSIHVSTCTEIARFQEYWGHWKNDTILRILY